MTPKFTALALRRMADVTSPSGTPKTWLATSVWMSSSRSNAAHIDGVLRIVGEDPQLDLRVVGGQQLPARLAGDERRADFAAFLGADGDVLQVRVAGAEPARGGDDLVERRVDAARFGVDHRRQRVDVGVLELRVLAVLDDLRRQRVRSASCSSTSASVLGPVLVFLTTGRLSSWNSTWASCLGEAMLSGWPASSSISCSSSAEPFAVAAAELGEPRGIDADAGEFQVGQHLDERHFDRFVELGRAPFRPAALSRIGMHAERDVGVFGGVGADFGDRHFVHPLLVFAFADQLVDFDRRVIEILLGEVVEVVAAPAGVEQVAGDHRVERDAGQLHADVAEHDHVVLEVLADLADGGFSRTGRSASSVCLRIENAIAGRAADGDVIRFARLERERIADDLGAARRDVRRFGVDADQRLLRQLSDQFGELFRRIDDW